MGIGEGRECACRLIHAIFARPGKGSRSNPDSATVRVDQARGIRLLLFT